MTHSPPPVDQHGPAAARRLPRNYLMRQFSLAGLIGVGLVTAVLIWIYSASSQEQMLEHESRANADLTALFANAVWWRHRDFFLTSHDLPPAVLRAHPGLSELDNDVRRKMGGLRVTKVKIFCVDGTTVYSTDLRQVGEDKSTNPGLKAALAGQVVSMVTFRERFDAFEGVVNNRSLVASYVPMRTPDGQIEGVVEVYSDVTDLLQAQQAALWRIVGSVLGCLAALYAILFAVVRKADRVIEIQTDEREIRETAARHQANHDMLTGLPNRAYFSERLDEALAQAHRHGREGALLFIDLDRFKIVNDSLGHEAGDQLLCSVAERIGKALRAGELLFRLGGDEFTVILPQTADPTDAAHAAQRIVQRIAEPFWIGEHELRISASIGIAAFPTDGNDTETLLKNSDAAMYTAKQAGRGTHAFYRREMNQRALHLLSLESALQRGFRLDEFVLFYQPRVSTATREIVALEALLRWHNPERGLVLPGEFIAVLEDLGMMPRVGEWVLRTACRQLVLWRAAGCAPQRISVNVSAQQFRNSGFAATVESVLRETGAPPECLELEVTESMLIHDAVEAAATIEALRALGLRVSMDDFGTGFSSLSYLRQFKVDGLKIDRSFVRDTAHNPRDRAVARAICKLAQALGIEVVAEGVETEEQAAIFTDLGCHELQGYLFARPLPVSEIETRLGQAVASTAPAGNGTPQAHTIASDLRTPSLVS
jgi:diguanylate cyclase (GGDEF)-like protein